MSGLIKHYNKKNKPEGIAVNKSVATVSQEKAVPITVRGQRYVPVAGRHSQQTHRIAEERATANGHATEEEQHAHDRTAVTTEINRVAQAKLNQQRQHADRTTVKKA